MRSLRYAVGVALVGTFAAGATVAYAADSSVSGSFTALNEFGVSSGWGTTMVSAIERSVATAAPLAGDGENSFCGNITACDGGHMNPQALTGGGINTHFSCLICDSDYGCHPACQVSQLSPDKRRAFEAILVAADDGDVAKIVSLSEQVPGFVFYNESRRSVQIASCSQGSFMANIPIESRRDVGVVASLPRSEAWSPSIVAVGAGAR
jgi:hypothetical protein